MHPNKTCKGKINPNGLNVPQEHRRKIRNLIHSNRNVVNSEKEFGWTQLLQKKIDTGNHLPKKLKPYWTPVHKRKLVEESLGPSKILFKEQSNKQDTIEKVNVPRENKHICPSNCIIFKIAISLMVVSVTSVLAIMMQLQLKKQVIKDQ